jgi:hypothetical protein
MSWDVILLHVPPEIATADDFPDGFSSELGPRPQVLSTLTALLPDLDLIDPTWAILDREDFHIEFNTGTKDPITTIMLHVRGGEGALQTIQRICDQTGWRALDTTVGDFIDFAGDPARGLREWTAFRDQVVAASEAKGKRVVTDAQVGRIRVDVMELAKPKKKWWHFWKKSA